MKEEIIRNPGFSIIGIVETQSNGDKTVYNYPEHQILGYYRKAQDQTVDFRGRILSYGDTAVALLYTQKR